LSAASYRYPTPKTWPCITGKEKTLGDSNLQVLPSHLNIIVSWIDLHRPSNEAISNLVNACEPATFGFNGENVYDESYRKAGKLDCTSFRPMLDISKLNLIQIVRRGLSRGLEAQKPIRAELYNLNIYGVVSLHLKQRAHA
jgi:hypothetical protein